ncbi:MAG: DUF5615 family PIN-like protein [Acidobacteriota bacterium]|jgi:hypothetical protein|nr:DUF5615 family PIN-like protein [Acidobacteriota bacterium]
MTTILLDHNLEGDADLLLGALAKNGWLEIVPIRLVTFTEVGLPTDSTDNEVWEFAQQQGMILLTDNRNMDGEDSMEDTLRRKVTADSIPVLTVGKRSRLGKVAYRKQCADRLAEIVLDLDRYLGYSRIYIP